MKTIIIFTAIFASLQLNAQNYLIAFTGTGAAKDVQTVKVENLTSGETLILNGTDILNLRGGVLTGITESKLTSGIKIYPNPMIDRATVEVYPPVSGNAIISIFDISGKKLIQIQSYLENSLQQFRLSGEGKGLYIINIKGSNYQLSDKLICNGNGESLTLENISNSQIIDKEVSEMQFKSKLLTTDMRYTTGDKLKFTGTSGSLELIKTDVINTNKTIEFNFAICKDADNNTYKEVEIDGRIWMAENLKTTKYGDGTKIALVTDSAAWSKLVTPAYCFYNNDISNKNIYGALYSYYVMEKNDLCPVEWHTSTREEWRSMRDYLEVNKYYYKDNSSNVAKSIASQSGWNVPQGIPGYYIIKDGFVGKNQATNNSTGFNGMPTGHRQPLGYFVYIKESANWHAVGDGYSIEASSYRISSWGINKNIGMSVRCVKD